MEDQEVSVPRMELETEPLEADIPELVRSPPTHPPEGQGSVIRSEFMSQAPLITHQTLSSPVQGQQAQKSIAPMCQASPPSTPVAPPTWERPTPIPEPPATDTRALFIEEIHTRREKSQQRAMSIEVGSRLHPSISKLVLLTFCPVEDFFSTFCILMCFSILPHLQFYHIHHLMCLVLLELH